MDPIEKMGQELLVFSQCRKLDRSAKDGQYSKAKT